jgi:hypothetical protein
VAGLEKGTIGRCFRLWQGDPPPLALVIYKLIITQPSPATPLPPVPPKSTTV